MKDQVLTRAYIVAGVLVCIGVVLFGQTFRIAVQQGDHWRAQSDSLYIHYLPIEAPRGNILSSDGNFLATSQQYYDIHMDTRAEGLTKDVFDEGIDSLGYYIHKHLQPRVSADSITRRLRAARKRGERYETIARNVDFPTYREIGHWPIFRRGANKGGLIAKRSEVRRRPFGMMAQRTIGYQRDDISVGLEGRFNQQLGGEAGRRPMMRLPGGHWLPVEDLVDAQPSAGYDVQTTLDVTVQDIVHQELSRAVSQQAAEYGVAIVLETRTGSIRAISSLTRESNGAVIESYNHAIGTAVEPGSTFKLASMLALLDEDRVKPEDTVRIYGGRYQFYDRKMEDSDKHGIDEVTAAEAFERSSNVGIARMVDLGYGNNLAGRQAYVNKIRSFHLDRPTGVAIDGEKHPFIKDPGVDSLRTWSGVTLPWMSMGYEVELTPLQMVAFYNAVANGGRYMQPRLVSNIQRDGEIVQEYAPLPIGKPIASKRAIAAAQAMLEGVVDRGTARKFNDARYRFAGKTGTVQYRYSESAKEKGIDGHQASFIGYFPADEPKYTIMVLISDPRAGYIYGSDVALPVWRSIADKIYAADAELRPAIYADASPKWQASTLPHRGLGAAADMAAIFAVLDAPDLDGIAQQMVRLTAPNDSLRIKAHPLAPGKVPDVRGMGARDAIFLLENAGCRVDLVGRGKVLRQSVAPNTKAHGQQVRLSLG